MPDNKFTDRKTGALLACMIEHMQACPDCRLAIVFNQSHHPGHARPCKQGYRLALDWLEWRSKLGDKQADFYIKGLEQHERFSR